MNLSKEELNKILLQKTTDENTKTITINEAFENDLNINQEELIKVKNAIYNKKSEYLLLKLQKDELKSNIKFIKQERSKYSIDLDEKEENYFIVDTNYFMHYPFKIDELINDPTATNIIIFSYVVLQELDGLTHSLDTFKRLNAQRATEFVTALLKEDIIHFQIFKKEDWELFNHFNWNKSVDDIIVDCCW